MAELVIKIDDETYKAVMERTEFDTLSLGIKLIEAVQDGIQLPKEHGDLIDKSKIYKAISAEEDNLTGAGMTFEEMDAYNDGIDAMYSLVKGARPIIKADKEYETKVITRGNCMMCGKELTEGLFICKDCENKANSRK